MFVYEKDNKINFEFNNTNQVPTTPDVTISAEGCVVVNSASSSETESDTEG